MILGDMQYDIKGQKRMFIGKTEINVINFWGTKKTIEYKEIEKIVNCYARVLFLVLCFYFT